MVYALFISLSLFLLATKIVDVVRVKKMTYEKLLAKCKKFISDDKLSSVMPTLLHHPKLLLLHFNELQTTLTEYAQSVEAEKNK